MRYPIIIGLAALPTPTLADAPQVVTDLAPIHSLVAQVMDGVGDPDVLVTSGASPHDFQFTFDQAAAVQNADLVIWVGPALTPWLAEAVDTLGGETSQLVLLTSENWPALGLRYDAAFADAHDHGQDDHDDHDDPHAWLDPQVAQAWVTTIADTLSDTDPDNAALYAANAASAIADLTALEAEITLQLADVPQGNLVVPHDAYQYFGARFDRAAVAAIALDDASAPTPDRISDLLAQIEHDDITCVLSDPQVRSEWSDLIREGSTARTALADPIGTTIPTGPTHYRATLTALAAAYAQCLGG